MRHRKHMCLRHRRTEPWQADFSATWSQLAWSNKSDLEPFHVPHLPWEKLNQVDQIIPDYKMLWKLEDLKSAETRPHRMINVDQLSSKCLLVSLSLSSCHVASHHWRWRNRQIMKHCWPSTDKSQVWGGPTWVHEFVILTVGRVSLDQLKQILEMA